MCGSSELHRAVATATRCAGHVIGRHSNHLTDNETEAEALSQTTSQQLIPVAPSCRRSGPLWTPCCHWHSPPSCAPDPRRDRSNSRPEVPRPFSHPPCPEP